MVKSNYMILQYVYISKFNHLKGFFCKSVGLAKSPDLFCFFPASYILLTLMHVAKKQTRKNVFVFLIFSHTY